MAGYAGLGTRTRCSSKQMPARSTEPAPPLSPPGLWRAVARSRGGVVGFSSWALNGLADDLTQAGEGGGAKLLRVVRLGLGGLKVILAPRIIRPLPQRHR